MEKFGRWVQQNVPAEEMLMCRARLCFVVWVTKLSQVTFWFRLSEGNSMLGV